MRLAKVDWKRELLGVALTAMEASWIAAWLMVVILGFAPGHPSWLLWAGVSLGLYGISWLVRLLSLRGLPSTVLSMLVLVLALISGLVFVRVHLYGGGALLDMSWMPQLLAQLGSITEAIPADAIALLAVFFIWWRGMALGSRAYTFESVGYSFRMGIVLLMWNAVVVALLGRPAPTLNFAFVFFFFGLLAVGLARVYDLEQQPEAGGAVSTRFWLGTTLAGIFAVLGVSFVATQLLTVGNLQAVSRWLNPVWKVLGAALSGVLYLLGLVLEPLMAWLIRFFQSRIMGQVLPTVEAPSATPEPVPQLPAAATPAYLEFIKYGLIALFFIGVLVLVAFSFRKMRARSAERRRDEEREIDWQWTPPGRGLAAALRAGLDKAGEVLNLARQFGLGERFRAAVSIRWIYANLLRLAEERKSTREAWQTPYEFLPVLRTAFPGYDEPLRAITEAYVQSHYGEVPTSEEELAQVRSYWEQIRAKASAPTP